MSHCEVCGTSEGLTRSHFVKKNSVHKTKLSKYDYESPRNYFIQCLNCHMEYEKLNKNSRHTFMLSIGMKKYANRIKWLINE